MNFEGVSLKNIRRYTVIRVQRTIIVLPRLPKIPQEADINRAVQGTAADGTVWQHKKRKKEVTRPNPKAPQVHRPVSGFASGLSGDMEHPAPAHPLTGTQRSLSAAPQPSINWFPVILARPPSPSGT